MGFGPQSNPESKTHNSFGDRTMCALQRVNPLSQQPEKEGQQGNPGVPWATTAGSPGQEGSVVSANGSQTQQMPPPASGGSIFSIPASPAPQDIPGFPAPPGSQQAPIQGIPG